MPEHGRRMEDNIANIDSVFSYRLGALEKSFEELEKSVDAKFQAHENVINIRLTKFEDKLEDVTVGVGQINLQDYRLHELEKWRSRLLSALTVVATGVIIMLLTQIILIATSPGTFPGPR
jgi:glutamyl-tRNA reductase